MEPLKPLKPMANDDNTNLLGNDEPTRIINSDDSTRMLNSAGDDEQTQMLGNAPGDSTVIVNPTVPPPAPEPIDPATPPAAPESYPDYQPPRSKAWIVWVVGIIVAAAVGAGIWYTLDRKAAVKGDHADDDQFENFKDIATDEPGYTNVEFDEPDFEEEIPESEEIFVTEVVIDSMLVEEPEVVQVDEPVNSDAAKPEIDDNSPLSWGAVEQHPQFPGGDAAMYKWIAENINYPAQAAEEGIQG